MKEVSYKGILFRLYATDEADPKSRTGEEECVYVLVDAKIIGTKGPWVELGSGKVLFNENENKDS